MYKPLVSLLFFMFFSTASFYVQADPAPDFTALVEKTGPTVVSVEIKSVVNVPSYNSRQLLPGVPDIFEDFFGIPRQYRQQSGENEDKVLQGEGSGFIIDAQGYVMTNAHVVDGADSVVVKLKNQKEYTAKVIGIDKRSDIALLKIEGDNLPVASLGDSDSVKVGDWVLAIGSPFGFDQTATKGIVSAIGRNLPSGIYTPFIQTDAAINPGNSGGPLFNSKGEVIGINSQIYTRSGAFSGLGFAIPINVAKSIAEQLKNGGTVTRGWLGVVIQGIDQKLAESFGLEEPVGALVADVAKNSPAEKAGIKQGDVILSYNDKKILKSSDLPAMVAITPIGKEVNVTILRKGEKKNLVVAVGNLDNIDIASDSKTTYLKKIGLQLSILDGDARQALGFEGTNGVLISKVVPRSPASRSGLRAGDILLAIGSEAAVSPDQVAQAVNKQSGDRPLPFLIYRNGQTIFIALVPEAK